MIPPRPAEAAGNARISTDPTLAELLALWPRLSDDARQSLLRIARAKTACRSGYG